MNNDLTVSEVAGELRVGLHRVYRLIRDGDLTAYSTGPAGTRVTRAALTEFKARGGVRGGLAASAKPA